MYYEWSEVMLNNWLALPQGYKVARVKFPEPVIDVTRDKAVQIAIQNGARWLWFVDADILPPKDALIKLLEADKPIVGGLYVRRHNPPFNEMLKFRTDGLPGLKPISDGEYTPGDIVECDAVATGCLLIKTEVFEKLKAHQITIDGRQARPAWFLWTEWRLPDGLSEDFEFATWAKKQGIPIYCHSVAPYSPIIVRDPQEQIHVLPISDLWNLTKGRVDSVGNQEIKHLEPGYNWRVFDRAPINDGGTYWTRIYHIARHAYQGELVRVNTYGGVLDVSPNHSLIGFGGSGEGQNLIDAAKISSGIRLAMPLSGFTITNNGGERRHNRWFFGTKDLAWLYGFFMAEGSAYKSTNYGVVFNNQRKDLLDKAQQIFEENFHLKTFYSHREDCSKVSTGSAAAYQFFREKFYTSNGLKQVPVEILNAPHKIQLAFLEGYWVGDGYNDKRISANYQSFSTNSQTLAAGVAWLIQDSLGRLASVDTENARPGILHVRFPKGVGTNDKREVKKIQRLPYSGYLYDLETHNHTFTAGVGAIKTHNTGVVCRHMGPIKFLPSFKNQLAIEFPGQG